MSKVSRRAVLLPLLAALFPAAVWGQDQNIPHPVETLEYRMTYGTFEVLDRRGSRFEGDRTSRVALLFSDSLLLAVKWARAAPGGEEQNNQPRYEAAAYELQKLFLEEPDYVVPPTVLRALPLHWYQELEPAATATFRGTNAVLVALQYWLFSATDAGVWDEARFATDTTYARHFANFNLLTYLIRHNDGNAGNALISTVPGNPRVFTVDNGMAFGSITSNRGAEWRSLRVSRLPAATVYRLRQVTEADLRRQLETVAQFTITEGGLLARVAPTENVAPHRGVRVRNDLVQLGLTATEIRRVWSRLQRLLEDVDEGRITLF